jgi:hypothetical protein
LLKFCWFRLDCDFTPRLPSAIIQHTNSNGFAAWMNIRLILKKRKKLDRSDPLRVKNDDVNRLVPTHNVLHLIYIWLSGDFSLFFTLCYKGGEIGIEKKKAPYVCVCVHCVWDLFVVSAFFGCPQILQAGPVRKTEP